MKKKYPLRGSALAKLAAGFLCISMLAIAGLFAFAGYMASDMPEIFFRLDDRDAAIEACVENLAKQEAEMLISYYLSLDASYDEPSTDDITGEMHNYCNREGFAVEVDFGEYTLSWGVPSEQFETLGPVTVLFHDSENMIISSARVMIYADSAPSPANGFYLFTLAAGMIYSVRYICYPLCLISFALSVLSFVFLMYAAGRHTGEDDIRVGVATVIPLEINATVCAAIVSGVVYLIVYILSDWSRNLFVTMVTVTVGGVLVAATTLFSAMDLATRVKLGGWWRKTLIYYLFRGLVRLCKAIPLVWKTVILCLLLALYTALCVYIALLGSGISIWLWAIGVLVAVPLAIWCAVLLRRLLEGSRRISNGDLEYKVELDGSFSEFRDAAENLNSIGVGMSRAVEEKIKSERFRTELITNVSHDIKTPLTSIISYSDLIKAEKTDNARITEYVDVISRQSGRLKKLIEDLIEASKASAGTMTVNLHPCETEIFIGQVVGEYQSKLERSGLQLVVHSEECRIMADGRMLWRILDNLMNNVCKYAQEGTRVYLSCANTDQGVEIVLRNTSRDELNISADELMERFVRGDSSRHSEGNGLGLSIAKSFTELQGGSFALSVDGDLFKVTLSFPRI